MTPTFHALERLSAAEAHRMLVAGSLKSMQLTRRCLSRIAASDHRLDAFITVTQTRALQDARRAGAEHAAGIDHGALHGVPVAIKDIFDTAGIRTTCNSHLFADHVPQSDSHVAALLAAAGAVLLGKTGTHEFAVGGPGFDLPFPPPRNPWSREHVPGGSSSGSAAAIAAGMTRIAIGSDTGGSIRHPAAYCGAVGLKPTYGRVSRRGAFALSPSLDTVGPLGCNVEDTAIALQVIAGHDPLDPASASVPVPDYLTALQSGVAGLRIGVARGWLAPGTAPELLEGLERVLAALRVAGARVEDAELPDFALFDICGRVILSAESFAVHADDLRRRPEAFGRIAFQRLCLGATLTAADLAQAGRVRRGLVEAMDRAMARYDVLLSVGVPISAPRFDAAHDAMQAGSPMRLMAFNVTGQPALAVPIGLDRSGLPIGLQIAGRAFDEPTVLRTGRAIERLSGWETIALPG